MHEETSPHARRGAARRARRNFGDGHREAGARRRPTGDSRYGEQREGVGNVSVCVRGGAGGRGGRGGSGGVVCMSCVCVYECGVWWFVQRIGLCVRARAGVRK